MLSFPPMTRALPAAALAFVLAATGAAPVAASAATGGSTSGAIDAPTVVEPTAGPPAAAAAEAEAEAEVEVVVPSGPEPAPDPALTPEPDPADVVESGETPTVPGVPAAPAPSTTPAPATSAPSTPLEVLSHVGGESYDAGPATFFGLGTPGARVVATNQWGVEMGRAAVGVNGRWAFTRNLGPTARSYQLVFTQTIGADRDQVALELFYAGSVELTVASHVDGQLYTAGPTVFAGHGAPNALVTVVDRRLGELARTTAALSGQWSVGVELAPTLDGYDLAVTQTRRDIEPQRVDLRLAYAAPVVAVAVDSHLDGQAYAPGVATFAGRGTVGARISAVNQWGTTMGSARVGVDGRWAFERNLGPTTSGYEVTVTQTRGLIVDATTLHLVVPVLTGLVITSPDPTSGSVDAGDVMTTFRGTGTPFATLTGVNQWGTAFGETTVAADGTWQFRRWLAVGTRYDLTFTQRSWTGETLVTDGIGFDVSP